MAKILVAWELGGGFGHVGRQKPIVERLVARGHHVTAALKYPEMGESFYQCDDVTYLQAPYQKAMTEQAIVPPSTFAHVLHNVCFSNYETAASRFASWRAIMREVSPDVIFFDHSPTALLAARTCPAARVVCGTGFCCPPPCEMYPDWTPWRNNEPGQLRNDEQRVLRVMNRLLGDAGEEPLERVSQIFEDVEDTFLQTYAELDHFRSSRETEYYGIMPTTGGEKVRWPAGDGKRIFVYVRPIPVLASLLKAFTRWELPAVLFVPTLADEVKARYRSPFVRFAERAVDLNRIASECDICVTIGSHATTAALLLAGKPQLTLPYDLEKTLIARNVMEMGAGLSAPPDNAKATLEALRMLLVDASFAKAAQDFAAKYENINRETQPDLMVARIESLWSH